MDDSGGLREASFTQRKPHAVDKDERENSTK